MEASTATNEASRSGAGNDLTFNRVSTMQSMCSELQNVTHVLVCPLQASLLSVHGEKVSAPDKAAATQTLLD